MINKTNEDAGLHDFYAALFNALPSNSVLLNNDTPKYTVLTVTPNYLTDTGKKKEDLVGKGFFEAFPSNEQDPTDTGQRDVFNSFEHVLRHKTKHQLPAQRYDVTNENGTFTERYWRAENTPVLAANGEVAYVIHTAKDITTDIKLAQQNEKIKSMELVNNLFMQTPFAIHIFTGPDLIIELANKRTLEPWGRDIDVIGKSYFEVMPELKGLGYENLMHEVMETGESRFFYEVSLPINRPGKNVGYFNFIYQPYYKDGQAKAESVLIVAYEVTEQVLAGKRVDESEKHLELLRNTVPAMIFYLDEEQRYRSYNETFMQWFGVNATEVIGKNVREFLGEEAYKKTLPHLAVAYTGQQEQYEVFAPSEMDIERWLSIVYTPHKTASGKVTGVIVLATDITHIKQAEIALQQSEQNLRNTILQAPVAMCILKGFDHVVEIANEWMFDFWGKTGKEVLGRPIFEGVPELKSQGYEDILRNVMLKGERFSAKGIPVRVLRNEKVETAYIDLLYEALRKGDGTITGIIAVAIDVTEQVLARQKIEEVVAERTKDLENANKELQRSNQNLEEFAHAASHDLKEPIRKIQVFTSKLKTQLTVNLKESELKFFGRIEHAAERMGSLVDDLLLYSHVSESPNEMEAVDLSQKMQQVLEDLELNIEEKKAEINIGILPKVRGYGRQLQQLFQNLVSNALKYSKQDVPPVVSIHSHTITDGSRTYYVITVKDNGIGFDQKYADNIFKMFSRLHGRNEYSGTGIGLSIVKKVVENHNGLIKVESSPGKGSAFQIFLPV